MKRILSAFLAAGLVMGGLTVKAEAATNDTFGISVSIQNTLSISLKDTAGADYTTWAITPAVALNTPTTMSSSNGIKVVTLTSFPVDLNAAAGTSTGGGAWIAGAVAGSGVYKLELKAFATPQATPDLTVGSTTILGTPVSYDLIVSGDRWVYAKLTTPTATTTGQTQTISVTITATVH
ncbi:MAG: hypothetical protein A2231_11195 [Candidatus Firestonebacteria bacterium RIFOXYA2_FULL_40_8]|nr:MAG: hypothetical protein A2231_11195 [Candidatus Firestonebacteria bacterium RIFOXYA2_FULL_40_8]